MKIVGIRKESGVYNQKPWESYVLTCMHDLRESDSDCDGTCCDCLRIKKADLESVFTQYGLTSSKDLIGLNILNVYYNQYRKICGFALGK
jgi:hypothetical protein